MSLRVLYSFPGRLGLPGIESIAWHQAMGLIAQGVEVTVHCGSCERAIDGARRVVETLKPLGVRVPYSAIGLDRAIRLHDFRVSRTLARRRGEFDLVHGWPLASLKTFQTAHKHGVATALERPNTHTRFAYEVVGEEVRRLGLTLPPTHSHAFNERRLAREEAEYALADKLMCPSPFVARTFLDRGFEESAIGRTQYGCDPSRFLARKRTVSDEDPFTVAFVGRCEPRKGLHFALEAWRKSGVCELGRFLIAGSFIPGYREAIADLLDHPSVEELGFVSDVPGVMCRSHALVLSSIEEGSALVTYEARACGCVLLVSDATGAPCEHNQTALMHHARDIDALAEHMALLERDLDLRRRLREASLATVDELTWETASKRVKGVYERAVESRRPVAKAGGRA
jgi:glycosyltransferase involved in cell wall biosynthesis